MVERGLASYERMLPPQFSDALERLTAKEHWIDMGAGEANAQRNYFSNTDRFPTPARATAVGVT
ncbi:MAG: hypothetical protein AAB425_00295, partial [Bdellovibrionota bacterium]